MVNLNACEQKPQIDYPSFWEYKIILLKEQNADELCKEILGQRDFKCTFSHTSKTDKYHSFLLRVCVQSEEDRLDIFNKLKSKTQFVL